MLGSFIGRTESHRAEKRLASLSVKRWSCYLVRCNVLSGSCGLEMPPSGFLPALVVLRKELLPSLLSYIMVEYGSDSLQNAR